MKTAAWKTRISSFLAVGLLGLAGVFSNGLPASAQTQEPCPLPAGVTAPADPTVTAQQVTNGSATLMDFALAVRERSREHSQQATAVEEGLYIGCAIRQDDGIWRSGNTYIVTLTLDGRVFVHAKDMSLSGRLLNPLIYGEILSALGVSPNTLADLIDPAKQQSAFAALVATLSQEPDGAFDATTPVPGLRPGIPGASGYAAVYNSPELQSPIVLIAGFDLNSSHLAPETIEHVTPTVTASQVVDRETLKAFVTAAGNYFLEILRTGDPTAAAKVKIALRDPNGPWRHGSVYLYVVDRTSNIISFHGAFPERFELQRPGFARDVVTGELILDQILDAAGSGPDGGFWRYHFDDPNDDTDSAEIPKTGYAREFSGQILGPDGSVIREVDLIVGSGLYGSAPDVVAEGGNAVIEAVLPQVMRAMTASTVDAVSGRIERATSDTAPDAAFSFGGASSLSDALLANGHALGNGTLDFSRLLAGSSFTMTLNAAGNGGSGLFGDLTFWGSGDYRNIAGGNPQSVDYDGSVVSANLGIDTKLGTDMLAGVAVSQARGTVDYTASNASGELTTSLTSVNPYVGWQMAGGMNLWAMAGYGSGEVEIDDGSAGAQSSDLTQRMVAAGVSGPLMSSDEMIAGGTTTLNLKGEAAFTSADVEGSGTLASMSLSATRQRLVLEGAHVQKLASGSTFTPSLELGVRNDGGDGETGTSIEAGGALRYADEASGLTVEGRVRTLLSHSGDYEETGVSGLVRLAPGGGSGRGLALVVQPAWGQTGSGVNQLWENGVTAGVSPDNQARLHTEVGYGLGVASGMGVVTPYAGLGLAGEGAQWWRMGARWQLAPAASVSVEGSLYEAANDDGPGHGLMLRGALRW